MIRDCLDAQASPSIKLLLEGVISTKICTGPYNIDKQGKFDEFISPDEGLFERNM